MTWAGRLQPTGKSFMNVRAFVDTNILVYAHDAGAGGKHETARVLVDQPWSERSGVISTQVLQELRNPFRTGASSR